MGFAIILVIGFLALTVLLLLIAFRLLRQQARSRRFLGLLVLFFVASLYLPSWQSPFYVSYGAEQVQEFAIDTTRLRLSRTRIIDDVLFVYTPTGEAIFWDDFAPDALRWMNNPTRLLLGWFRKKAQVLVADLKARQASWLPAEAVNFDESHSITALAAHLETRKRSEPVIYPFPGKDLRAELSFFGFSLPKLVYQTYSPPFGDSGWYIDSIYFGWTRLAVRESESGSVVVELAQTVFNSRLLATILGHSPLVAWLPAEGNFLIFSAARYGDLRVLALGPFST